MTTIAMSAGHAGYGITPGKRGPDGKVEWLWNDGVVRAFITYMARNHPKVRVIRVDDPTGRTDVPLATRVARANAAKADIYIDVHHNAMGSSWTDAGLGIETYINSPVSANPKSYALAKAIHPKVVNSMGLRDRGIKALGFYVLKHTHMPAVLTEGGFMDSRTDRREMDNDPRIKAQGEAIAQGAEDYLNLEKQQVITVSATQGPKYYRVRTSWEDARTQEGAFISFAIAKAAADARYKDGYNVYDASGKLVHKGEAPIIEEITMPPIGEDPMDTYQKEASAGKSLIAGQIWAKENEISDGTYPERPLTRAEFWETLRRYDEFKEK